LSNFDLEELTEIEKYIFFDNSTECSVQALSMNYNNRSNKIENKTNIRRHVGQYEH
ncbi:5760_t:CDS:1, partial [Gigaspora margarita]